MTTICLVTSMLSTVSIAAADSNKNKIPKKMEPGTTITYNLNLEPTISSDALSAQSNVTKQDDKDSKKSMLPEEFKDSVDKKGRAAEDRYVDSIREAAKNLPVIDLGYDLPAPAPGMVVMYGSDGLINRIYSDNKTELSASSVSTAATIPSTTVKYPGRLPAGVYTYGTNQKITITSNTVLGEGRFTVFRAGVGGSGTIGSSGKTLEAGDVATKRQIDNPKHNTAINARALDTNVLKTVYKNDIGSLPDAVMDVYFWNWTDPFFGYMYSDTLSFPGRYFYQF